MAEPLTEPRRIVQMLQHPSEKTLVLVSADDGTLWELDTSHIMPKWRQLPSLPEREVSVRYEAAR